MSGTVDLGMPGNCAPSGLLTLSQGLFRNNQKKKAQPLDECVKHRAEWFNSVAQKVSRLAVSSHSNADSQSLSGPMFSLPAKDRRYMSTVLRCRSTAHV